MAHKTYQISDDDWQLAYGYIERAMKRKEVSTSQGYTQFLSIQSGIELQQWCDDYLSNDVWRKLKTSMRQMRKRGRDYKLAPKKSIDLSHTAWLLLSSVAKEENCTLSEAIERMEASYWQARGRI